MDEDMTELGRRAVACKGWRWLPGMATNSKFRRVVDACPVERVPCCAEEGATEDDCHAVWLEHNELLPNLTDPATLGCLLAMVREAWGDPGMFVRPRGSKMRPDWAVFTGANSDIVCAALSEAEALIAALEAASCR